MRCQLPAMGVSPSWYYKWAGGELPPRAARRERLKAEVGRLFSGHEGKCGSPRVAADLKDAGWTVSENTVAALMRELGLAARRKKRRKATTRPGKGRWRAPDLVKRDFRAGKINRKWFGDGTEIVTGEGKLMGRPGSALDNAMIESWHSTLEFELRSAETFATRAQARARVAAWIEEYNTSRRHSACQMMAPVAWELAVAASDQEAA